MSQICIAFGPLSSPLAFAYVFNLWYPGLPTLVRLPIFSLVLSFEHLIFAWSVCLPGVVEEENFTFFRVIFLYPNKSGLSTYKCIFPFILAYSVPIDPCPQNSFISGKAGCLLKFKSLNAHSQASAYSVPNWPILLYIHTPFCFRSRIKNVNSMHQMKWTLTHEGLCWNLVCL